MRFNLCFTQEWVNDKCYIVEFCLCCYKVFFRSFARCENHKRSCLLVCFEGDFDDYVKVFG